MNPIYTAVKYFTDAGNGIPPELFPLMVGGALGATSPGPEVEKKLLSVPTEVSTQELRFMYHFANAILPGQHNILEIGPLFGGTTRALAMGLQNNPNRSPDAKVYTYDQFCAYYNKESHLKKLQDYNALTAEIEKEVKNGPEHPEFRKLFDLLHQDSDYFKLLDINKSSLPDRREHIPQMKLPIFRPPESKLFEYVMIDACKSWFSTKYFMTQMLPKTPVGAVYHFQDYAWYSCFWLPVFTTIFREHFELISFVNTSYIFRLKKEIQVSEVEKQFPDSPEQFSAETYESVFDLKINEAIQNNDLFGMTFSTLQKASALGYIGEKDKAKAILNELKLQPFAQKWVGHVENALVSPSYYPPTEPSGITTRVYL